MERETRPLEPMGSGKNLSGTPEACFEIIRGTVILACASMRLSIYLHS